MRIATAPALIGFEERRGDLLEPQGCSCLHCVSRASARRTAARAGAVARAGRIPQLGRTVRTTCLATTVLAGAGVIGLGLGAGTANAESAPSRPGWDGSKYWFQNESGAWRWTVHQDVYLSRTSGTTKPAAPAKPAVSTGDGMRQGWDGSKYWFRNESGEWRYTSYYEVYLSRTSGAPAAPAPTSEAEPSTGDGMRQGWDGSKYWFRNESGEWRYTSYYDVYLSRTSSTDSVPSTGSNSSGDSTSSTDSQASADRRTSADSTPSTARTELAIAYAMAQLGKPYIWGGDGPVGYDCSGLVQQAYLRAGIELPRVANDQYAATTPISSGQLRRGDLIFWSDSSRASGIHHVAIYLGGSRYLEAPRPGKTVQISTLSSAYYPTHLGRP